LSGAEDKKFKTQIFKEQSSSPISFSHPVEASDENEERTHLLKTTHK